uniref:Defensin I n=1 Tax=Mayetiola destructor TaxID=39758 RepID=Q2QKD4_MAYDE|nr:defensin I [Mayetiola destructor]
MNFKLLNLFAMVLFGVVVISNAAKPPSGFLTPDADNDENGNGVEEQTLERFTCDIWQNQAACAIHCIANGFRGGYCNAQKVCVCRR